MICSEKRRTGDRCPINESLKCGKKPCKIVSFEQGDDPTTVCLQGRIVTP